MNLAPYRKLIVALLGAAIIAADQFFGLSLSWGAEEIVSTVVPLLTALGVWAAPNSPA